MTPQKAIQHLVNQLRQSEHGQVAADALWTYLDTAGHGLDAENQTAVEGLIKAAHRGYIGTVLEALKH
ncbi:hypothetical protein [Geminisphaera colitermitum]|uniref:hypothetical protein n=1 Tax=Geminisphaera colitermitum TaxID=1148786 RepID=UPI000158D4AF|nr:hypothetical protein [Geminisphaera colitermitum]